MDDSLNLKTLKDVFHNVDCASAKSHIRLAARSILLKDFNYDFPNPLPPRNRVRGYKGDANVEVEPKHGYNPVPGAFGSRTR